MNTQFEIRKKEKEIAELKNQLAKDRAGFIAQFNSKMTEMINKTPTGELRNNLTDLNILFQAVVEHS